MAWIQMNFQSNALFQSTTLNVIIPAETMEGMPPRPRDDWRTVYLLHGLGGDSTHWMMNTKLNELAQLTDTCFIMPSGDNSFYLNSDSNMNKYSDFIGKEMVEFTRKMLPLSHKREETAIGGLSMGGYGALYNGLIHNETFGHIIALSPALIVGGLGGEAFSNPALHNDGFFERVFGHPETETGTDKDLVAVARKVLAEAKQPIDLYLACGYNDMLVHLSRDYSRKLNEMGLPHTYEEGPGTHEWAFWDKFVRRGVAHAFGIEIPEGIPQTLNPFYIEKPAE